MLGRWGAGWGEGSHERRVSAFWEEKMLFLKEKMEEE